MVDRIEGKLKRTNKKRKQTTRFTIQGDMKREEWAELYEKIKVTLDRHGVKVWQAKTRSPSARKKTSKRR